MKPLTLAALFAVSSLVACSQAAPAAGDSTANDTTGTATANGDEFVRCWSVSDGNADTFFRQYTVTCHLTSAALAGLDQSMVAVDVHGADSSTVESGIPTQKPDTDMVIGTVTTSAFPLEVDVYGNWGTGEGNSTAFRTKLSLTQTADASAPLVVRLPFQRWNVMIVNKGSVAVVSAPARTLDAAPFFTSPDDNSTQTTFTTSATTGVLRSDPGSLVLLTKGDAVAVEVQGDHGEFDAKIDGPGTWVVDGDTLTKSADAAPAIDAGTNSTPTTDPTDAGSPTPAPTCGAAGMQHCTQDNGSWTCNDGTRADTSSGLCVACGSDGETYCFVDPNNAQGNWSCDAGTRLDNTTNTCVACGAAGQTHCFADPNNVQGNWSCNAGLTYSTDDGLCH